VIARERGIRLLEAVDEDAGSWQSLIKVRASTRPKDGKVEESHVVAGTVFGRVPRIVRIDDLHVDLEPRGPILITLHADVPGVVGILGTLLGEERVNIRRIGSVPRPPLTTGPKPPRAASSRSTTSRPPASSRRSRSSRP
jgi:hypothetical protein